MNGKNINFNNKNIKKSDFYNKNKKIFNIDDIDVNKILVSKKEPYGKNNALNDNDVIRPLYLSLSQMTGCIKNLQKSKIITTTMSLRVKDKQLLKNYDKIWEKIERLMGINFDSKPFYGNDDNKYVKTKKTFKESIITNFRNEKRPKEDVSYKCKCLSIIILDSVIKSNKKYYLQMYLDECKYKQQQKQKNNYIDEDLKSDSDSNNETESDSDSNDDETKFDFDNDE